VPRMSLPTRIRAAVAGGAVLCLASGVVTAAPAGAGGSGDVVAAHLRFTVTTSSDWTQLHVSPGTVVAARLVDQSGSGSYTSQRDGLSLQGMSGVSTFVVDVVLFDPSPSTSYTVTLCKGYLGTATVRVANLNQSTESVAGTFSDSVHNSSDASNASAATVSRDALMTGTPMPLPHADDRRMVLAFYYPWFADYSDPHLADRPVDPRGVYDPAGVTAMTQQAKNHGVDGFVVSWMGQEQSGTPFDVAMRAAEGERQTIAGYIETKMATSRVSLGHADPRVVRQWLAELLQRSGSRQFLRADGGPVVFVYLMEELPAKKWQGILAAVNNEFQTKVHLVGDTLDPDYLPLEYGVHRYAVMSTPSALTSWSRTTSLNLRGDAVLDANVKPRLFVGTVQPGFDDRKLRGQANPVIQRDGGARYDQTWSAALSGSPDWVVVTSWNEWFEDTQIEPGVDTGGGALDQTASWSQTFKSPTGG
jgi:hypothetical protein